jgi:hypothetical protein
VKTAFEHIWEFIRGDLPTADFERLAYNDASLEDDLGPAPYLEVIGTDFRSGDAVWRLKERLKRFLRERDPRRCGCIELRDLAVVDMGEESDRVLRTFGPVATRGDPYWWLSLQRCAECGQRWLVGEESRQNDVYCLRRLDAAAAERIAADGVWPPDFDRYEALLVAGKAAGKSVRFADPVGDSSLGWTMEDLARARPGIELSVLAELLNLDLETARAIAETVVAEKGVEIDLKG